VRRRRRTLGSARAPGRLRPPHRAGPLDRHLPRCHGHARDAARDRQPGRPAPGPGRRPRRASRHARLSHGVRGFSPLRARAGLSGLGQRGRGRAGHRHLRADRAQAAGVHLRRPERRPFGARFDPLRSSLSLGLGPEHLLGSGDPDDRRLRRRGLVSSLLRARRAPGHGPRGRSRLRVAGRSRARADGAAGDRLSHRRAADQIAALAETGRKERGRVVGAWHRTARPSQKGPEDRARLSRWACRRC
jgi:hypothetical protein